MPGKQVNGRIVNERMEAFLFYYNVGMEEDIRILRRTKPVN